MKRVALFTHQDCLGHDPGIGHPECPDRLRSVLSGLDHPDFANLLREQAPQASFEQLARVHAETYLRTVFDMKPPAGEAVALDADTYFCDGSLAAARRAAGGAIAAVDAVMEGWADAAFAAVRPPGHHAERGHAMGFCVFANAAVAALHARARWGIQRIAVVDFDVHHGNGTQHIFAEDADLCYVSSHQFPCYPGTGAISERGVAGNVLNIPLAPGAGSTQFRQAWETIGLPALLAFRPDLLIVSAGFDAHKFDPLAQLRLETQDFGWITDQLMGVAEACCQGRIVSLMEGGYDLAALAASACLHVRRLMEA